MEPPATDFSFLYWSTSCHISCQLQTWFPHNTNKKSKAMLPQSDPPIIQILAFLQDFAFEHNSSEVHDPWQKVWHQAIQIPYKIFLQATWWYILLGILLRTKMRTMTRADTMWPSCLIEWMLPYAEWCSLQQRANRQIRSVQITWAKPRNWMRPCPSSRTVISASLGSKRS